MVSGVVRYAHEDPVWLVESCQRAIEWMLRSHAASGRTLRRGWSEVPYREEAITRLQEELLPAMAALLERGGRSIAGWRGRAWGLLSPSGSRWQPAFALDLWFPRMGSSQAAPFRRISSACSSSLRTFVLKMA
jgi:hypothetical protein